MRALLFGSASSATLTAVAALSLRASDATLAVAAVASGTVLLTWFAGLHSTDTTSGLALTGPAAALSLAVVRRYPWPTLLPLVAGQTLGAVLAGLGALALDDHWGPTLVLAEPDLVVAGVVAGLAGLLGTWAIVAVDSEGPTILSAAPVVVAGSLSTVALSAAAQPAALMGLATADLLPWDVAAVAAVAALAGSVIGAILLRIALPPSEGDV